MSIFITLIAALIVFSAVIAIHEFGHFTVAKLCGIQVNEFSIGMGPALWKKIYKGTQYSLRALPVGGYVALEGEESPESQQAEAVRDEREAEEENPVPPEQRTGIPLNEAPVWQRVLVMVQVLHEFRAGLCGAGHSCGSTGRSHHQQDHLFH